MEVLNDLALPVFVLGSCTPLELPGPRSEDREEWVLVLALHYRRDYLAPLRIVCVHFES